MSHEFRLGAKRCGTRPTSRVEVAELLCRICDVGDVTTVEFLKSEKITVCYRIQVENAEGSTPAGTNHCLRSGLQRAPSALTFSLSSKLTLKNFTG